MKLGNKIGVIVDSFGVGVREGLKKAQEVGADGVQIYAVKGEMDPDQLTSSGRKELKKYIESLGLEISALVGDLGGHGFQDKSHNAWKVEKSKRILDLAKELGTDIVTTHIGIVPHDRQSELFETMHSACEELGQYAKSMGSYFAIETGPETADELKAFLDTLSTNGVSVNFDPANLVMVTGDDPVRGVLTLKDYIVHTHVKDGIRRKPVDPRAVYGSIGYKPMENENLEHMLASGEFCQEVPLGEGQVNFDAYFKTLQEVGYTGYLTIEREVGDQPETDIRKAVEFIKRYK